MVSGIYINMSISNLERSMEFFTGLGFTFNPQFTNDHGACLIVSPTISVMLVHKEKFEELAKRPVAPRDSAEMLLSLQCETVEEVRRIAETAFSLGGKQVNEFEDHGFMQSWAFEDLDGHLWDLFCFDPNQLPK